MLIVMNQKAIAEEIDAVVKVIESKGYTARAIPGGERVSIGILHNQGPVDASLFLGLRGVKDVIPITRPYKLVSREFHPDNSIIRVGDIDFGGDFIPVIAGPCAVESEAQSFAIGERVKAAGATLFR